MNTRQLQYVIAIAQAGSFSEAARKLLISQPSLSQYVRKLEEELGVELFERSLPLRLTYAGRKYVETAQGILDAEQDMLRVMSDISNEKTGFIRVGAGPFNSVNIVPFILQKFKQEYPAVIVEVVERLEAELFELVTRGEINLALTTMKVSGSEFEVTRIMDEDFMLAVPRDFELNRKYELLKGEGRYPEIDIGECRDYPFIGLDENLPIYRTLVKMCREAGFIPNVQVRCTSVGVAHTLTMAGAGISIIPSGILLYSAREEIRYYLMKQSKSKRTLSVFYKRDKYMTKAMQRLIELMVKQHDGFDD